MFRWCLIRCDSRTPNKHSRTSLRRSWTSESTSSRTLNGHLKNISQTLKGTLLLGVLNTWVWMVIKIASYILVLFWNNNYDNIIINVELDNQSFTLFEALHDWYDPWWRSVCWKCTPLQGIHYNYNRKLTTEPKFNLIHNLVCGWVFALMGSLVWLDSVYMGLGDALYLVCGMFTEMILSKVGAKLPLRVWQLQ